MIRVAEETEGDREEEGKGREGKGRGS